VVPPNEFWLALHRLADAYDAEGLTTDERATNIVEQFMEMPAIARRHVHSDLLRIAVYIPDLAPLIAAAETKVAEQQPSKSRLQTG